MVRNRIPTARSPGTWSAFLLLGLGLVGCAAFEVTDNGVPPPETEAVVPAPEPRKRPAHAVVQTGPPAKDEPALSRQAEADLPALDRLTGLGFAAVEAVLGPPVRVREEAPARIWTFRDGPCELEVSFFPDLETLDYHVLSYRIAGAEQDNLDEYGDAEQRCRDIFRQKLRDLGGAGRG